MKKSFIYRTLQITAGITVYSVTSVWASTAHLNVVSEILTNINTLLVTLAIAVAFPYFCFKVLSKLYTPPTSRNGGDFLNLSDSDFSQDEFKTNARDLKTMQYRGTRYEDQDLRIKAANNEKIVDKSRPVIKYRGVNIEHGLMGSSPEVTESSSTESISQKLAKPKDRMKYRGSYLD